MNKLPSHLRSGSKWFFIEAFLFSFTLGCVIILYEMAVSMFQLTLLKWIYLFFGAIFSLQVFLFFNPINFSKIKQFFKPSSYGAQMSNESEKSHDVSMKEIRQA
ncbi:hypothetical protein CYY_004003 [Polysphondylium violaceum]|uniref:Uncharacterized protein n=1 Tax=Polysphondylium violaceum TaxID=133409 RepID=A0A8J4PXM4_9MYCE|nr:hypothetical protein CYY_004003 [Polysphondylium violaceum]